jgi:hypothetical protein
MLRGGNDAIMTDAGKLQAPESTKPTNTVLKGDIPI